MQLYYNSTIIQLCMPTQQERLKNVEPDAKLAKRKVTQ